jgi:protein gp37
VRFISAEPLLTEVTKLELADIDWLIVGGESGPRARPLDLRWALELAGKCSTTGTAFFMKQLGTVLARHSGAGDRKGTDPAIFPRELRRREMPEPRVRLAPALPA